jgi:hypothetical protein
MAKAGAKKKNKLERKIAVTVYITGKEIVQIGGMEKAREYSLSQLQLKAEQSELPI